VAKVVVQGSKSLICFSRDEMRELNVRTCSFMVRIALALHLRTRALLHFGESRISGKTAFSARIRSRSFKRAFRDMDLCRSLRSCAEEAFLGLPFFLFSGGP